MTDEKLLDFVRQQSAQGVEKSKIKADLLGAGWREADIDSAFLVLSPQNTNLEVNNLSIGSGLVATTAVGLLGPIQILSKAFAEYKKHFFTYVSICIPLALLGLLINLFSGQDFGGNISPTDFMLLFAIPIIFVFLWSYSALISAIVGNKNGDDSGIIKYYTKGLSKIPSLLWVNILLIIVLFAAFLLFILPGIIFFVYLVFANYFIFDQNIKGRRALEASRTYVSGYWWKVAIRLLFIVAIFYIMGIIVQTIFAIVDLSQVADLINNIFLYPVAVISHYILYSNLKDIKGLISVENLKRKDVESI